MCTAPFVDTPFLQRQIYDRLPLDPLAISEVNNNIYLLCWIHFRKHKNKLALSIDSIKHPDVKGNWNRSWWMENNCSLYQVIIMTIDVLASGVYKVSAAMVLFRNILDSDQKRFGNISSSPIYSRWSSSHKPRVSVSIHITNSAHECIIQHLTSRPLWPVKHQQRLKLVYITHKVILKIFQLNNILICRNTLKHRINPRSKKCAPTHTRSAGIMIWYRTCEVKSP